jgi:hypothetical protein
MPETAIPGAETVPTDLLEAFTAYERAIMRTISTCSTRLSLRARARCGGMPPACSWDMTRSARSAGCAAGVPPRVIERLEHRELGPEVALLVSISRFAGGGTGLQTQIWERIDGRWLITAAHVTPRSQALDRSVWRTVGDPLWQGAWEGALAGLTVAVKDLFAIKGYRIGAGNPAFLDEARAETTTAAVVTDLLRGGGVAARHRPHRRIRVQHRRRQRALRTPPNGALPGALRADPRAVRRPPSPPARPRSASRPTRRVGAGARVVPGTVGAAHDARPGAPAGACCPSRSPFDTIGWLTRDSATLQRVVDWCLSYDGSESTENVYGESDDDLPWRFVVPTEVLDAVEPETRAAFDAFLSRLAESTDAAPVEFVSIGDLDDYFVPFRTVQGAERGGTTANGSARTRMRWAPPVADRFRIASEIAPRRRHPRAARSSPRRRVHALVAAPCCSCPPCPDRRRCAPPSATASTPSRRDARMTTPPRSPACRRSRRRCSPVPLATGRRARRAVLA